MSGMGDRNFVTEYAFDRHVGFTSGIGALTSNIPVAATTAQNLAKYCHTSAALYSGVVLMYTPIGTYSGSVCWVKI